MMMMSKLQLKKSVHAVSGVGGGLGAQQLSLIKYGRAELVQGNENTIPTLRYLQRVAQDQQLQASGGCGSVTDPLLIDLMQHACKEAALSQIDKTQILEAIIPPREWEDDGKRYRQMISNKPATRSDVSELNAMLNDQLTQRQARPDGICPIRRELADQCFDELIRQVTLSQAERGLLLLRVRDELRMTLSAYQDLFVSSRDYDSRKTVGKDTQVAHGEISTKVGDISSIVRDLERTKEELLKGHEHREQIIREERESENKRHHEEFQFLKRVNNALKQQIDAMIDPENNIDPVIQAYEGVKDKSQRTTSRRRKGCDT